MRHPPDTDNYIHIWCEHTISVTRIHNDNYHNLILSNRAIWKLKNVWYNAPKEERNSANGAKHPASGAKTCVHISVALI